MIDTNIISINEDALRTLIAHEVEARVEERVKSALSAAFNRPLGEFLDSSPTPAPVINFTPADPKPRGKPGPKPKPKSKSEAKRVAIQSEAKVNGAVNADQDHVIETLRTAGGSMKAIDLSSSLGWAKGKYHNVLKELRADKRVKVEGQKRGTRYILDSARVAKVNGIHASN